jgi:hypothetical protein
MVEILSEQNSLFQIRFDPAKQAWRLRAGKVSAQLERQFTGSLQRPR